MQRPEAGKPVVRLSHCQKYVYSFGAPRRCPLCGQDVGPRRLEEAPVSISEPFTDGHREKCSFLLRPTRGTFLRFHMKRLTGKMTQQLISSKQYLYFELVCNICDKQVLSTEPEE